MACRPSSVTFGVLSGLAFAASSLVAMPRAAAQGVPNLPPPPPPPLGSASAQVEPAPLPSTPLVPTVPSAQPPAGAVPASTLDGEQERRLGELELRIKQLEEKDRLAHEEQDEWWGWARKVHFSGYLQPQGLWQWYNDAASPNATGGVLPPGIGPNDVIAKSDTVFGGTSVPGLTTNGDYFRLRRARLKVELDPSDYAAMIFEIDPTLAGGPDNATGTIARNVEADGIVHWGGDVVTTFGAGIFKIPYGFEVLQTDADRPFIERSWWEQNNTPGEFDTGAKAYTRALGGKLTNQFAVINGETEGEKTFSLLPDLNQGKDILGRVNYNFGAFDLGTSGYYGQGSEVLLTSLAFKEYPRAAWNLEGALHEGFLPIGQSRVFGEFNLAQNMDRGVHYGALALPGLPTPASAIPGTNVVNRHELGGFIRAEQDFTHWSTLAVRYDYYTPDTSIANDGRHTFGVVGVAHFTEQLQLMVEYDHYIDNVRAAGAPQPNAVGDVLSTVFQVRYP